MERRPDSPNFLFIMTDQQRFDALSCHKGLAQTPHLDQLCERGVSLNQHFSQSPVCVPSRCSLFTGRYTHSHRVLENNARLADHEVHLFKCLKQAGYTQGYFGKNHLLPEEQMIKNFDRFNDAHNHEPAPSESRLRYRQLEKEAGSRLATVGSYASAQFHDFPDHDTTTGVIANSAIEFIGSAPADKPWAAVASFYDPHAPHLAPRRFAAQYPLEEIEIPEFDPKELDTKPARIRIKREAQNSHQASLEEKRHYLAAYSSMCSFIDEKIGEILAALEKRDDFERTVIVFVSDHGDFGWNHGLCKKDLLLYDNLLHVPAILSCPARFDPKTIENTLSEHVDIMPTLLDLANLPLPKGCQGKSLKPLLEGKTESHRDEIHAEICYPDMRCDFDSYQSFREAWKQANQPGATPSRLRHTAPFNIPGDYTKCVRTQEWKYIWYGDGFEELYNVKDDPGETQNLAATAENSQQKAELKTSLFEWLALYADPKSPRDEKEQIESYSSWKY